MTIKEIAQLANVSTATVSRVLNGNGRYSPETEQRIKEIVAKNNYTPNISAKNLRTNQSNIIAIIIPDIRNAYFSDMLLEIGRVLAEHGYAYMVFNIDENETLEERAVQQVARQHLSGIIFVSGAGNYPALANIPKIYMDRRPRSFQESCVLVESDNRQGGYLAARHLLERGCRRIALVHCLKNAEYGHMPRYSAFRQQAELSLENKDYNQLARYNGYRDALVEQGIKRDRQLFINVSDVAMESAQAAVTEFLKKAVPFDAIMCTTDTMAAGSFMALRSAGIRVPEDVLLTGFDDSNLAPVCGPGLTSVRQNLRSMAEVVCRLLLKQIQGLDVPEKHYILPVSLTVRHSTFRSSATGSRAETRL